MSADPGPETLLALAAAALEADILPALPPAQRYAGAIVLRALAIVRRGLTDEGEEARFALLDQAYDDGEGSLEQLARDIRSGEVDEADVPDLRSKLRRIVTAELKVRNPAFLASRAGKR